MIKYAYDHVRLALYCTTNHLKYLGLLLEPYAAAVLLAWGVNSLGLEACTSQ